MKTRENRNEANGLCMTCNHANLCVYLANASSTVWNCEEFDDRAPVFVPVAKISAAQTISTGESVHEQRIRKAS